MMKIIIIGMLTFLLVMECRPSGWNSEAYSPTIVGSISSEQHSEKAGQIDTTQPDFPRKRKKDRLAAAPMFLNDSLDAAHDIANNRVQLYCGIGFIVAAKTKADKAFEKRYALRYKLVGCVLPASSEQIVAYNTAVAKHLDNIYGLEWRREVRQDVPGITRVKDETTGAGTQTPG